RLEDRLVGLELGTLLRGVRALAGLVDAGPCVGGRSDGNHKSGNADSGNQRTRQLEHLRNSLCKQKSGRGNTASVRLNFLLLRMPIRRYSDRICSRRCTEAA